MLEILIDMNAKGLNYLFTKFQVNKKNKFKHEITVKTNRQR